MLNIKTWQGRFQILIMLMVYGAFDPRYYLWVRKIVTSKKGTVIDDE